MAEEKQFLSVSQFAKLVGVHPQTVRSWDVKGEVKPHHRTFGGKRFYSKEQVNELFESSCIKEGSNKI